MRLTILFSFLSICVTSLLAQNEYSWLSNQSISSFQEEVQIQQKEDKLTLFYNNAQIQTSYHGTDPIYQNRKLGYIQLSAFILNTETNDWHCYGGTSTASFVFQSTSKTDPSIVVETSFPRMDSNGVSFYRKGMAAIRLSDSVFVAFEAGFKHIFTLKWDGTVADEVKTGAYRYQAKNYIRFQDYFVFANDEGVQFINEDGNVAFEYTGDWAPELTDISTDGANIWVSTTGPSFSQILEIPTTPNGQISTVYSDGTKDFQSMLYNKDENKFLVASAVNTRTEVDFISPAGILLETFNVESDKRPTALVKSKVDGHYFLQLSGAGASVQIIHFSQNTTALKEGLSLHPKLEANEIRTMTNPNGSMFWDYNDGYFKYPSTEETSTIFSANPWFSFWADQELNAQFENYGLHTTLTSFVAGPIEAQPFHAFNRIWNISREKIQQVEQDLADGQKDENWSTSILEWPAKGNVYTAFNGRKVEITEDLAPFYDKNGDGFYQPLEGDLPILKGDQMLFWIMRDSTPNQSSRLEVQGTMYAFGDADVESPINRSVFVDFVYKNKTNFAFSAFKNSLFIDVDLGCHTDDYIGSHEPSNALFAYNQTAQDETQCQGGVPNYGINVPVQSAYLLSDDLEGIVIGFNDPSFDPFAVHAEYNEQARYLMESKDLSGMPFLADNQGLSPTGQPTTFLFPGNPANTNEWSMCSTNSPASTGRALLNSRSYPIEPNQSQSFTYGFTVHPNLLTDACTDFLGEMADEIEETKDYLRGIIPSEEPKIQEDGQLSIFPNPSADFFQINSQLKDQSSCHLQIFSQNGQLLLENKNQGYNQPIRVAHFPEGMYFVKIMDEESVRFGSFVKQ